MVSLDLESGPGGTTCTVSLVTPGPCHAGVPGGLIRTKQLKQSETQPQAVSSSLFLLLGLVLSFPGWSCLTRQHQAYRSSPVLGWGLRLPLSCYCGSKSLVSQGDMWHLCACGLVCMDPNSSSCFHPGHGREILTNCG